MYSVPNPMTRLARCYISRYSLNGYSKFSHSQIFPFFRHRTRAPKRKGHFTKKEARPACSQHLVDCPENRGPIFPLALSAYLLYRKFGHKTYVTCKGPPQPFRNLSSHPVSLSLPNVINHHELWPRSGGRACTLTIIPCTPNGVLIISTNNINYKRHFQRRDVSRGN